LRILLALTLGVPHQLNSLMNRMSLLLCFLLVSSLSFAQNAVSWTFNSKKVADNKYELHFVADVNQPWHIYSTTQADGGPLPTRFSFAKNPLTSLDGGVAEKGKMQKHFEEVFGIDTKFYNDKVEFVQVVNVKGKAKTNVTGTLEFMACTDKECLPPRTVPFNIALN
jgi:hypothetical protein